MGDAGLVRALASSAAAEEAVMVLSHAARCGAVRGVAAERGEGGGRGMEIGYELGRWLRREGEGLEGEVWSCVWGVRL